MSDDSDFETWDDDNESTGEFDEENEENDEIGSETSEYEEPSYEFQKEATAHERTSFPNISSLIGKTIFTGNNKDLYKNINRLVQNPSDRFALYVDAISRKMISDNIQIFNKDIEILLLNIEKLKYVQHKNPTAYILGYLSTQKNIIQNNIKYTLHKKNFNYVIQKVLPTLSDDFVSPPDIIRYAKLWENLN